MGRRSTHGMTNSPENQAWRDAKCRCHNPAHRNFAAYGGRGIKMAAVWRNSFERFYADMGPRPDGHSLDRIKNNLGYGPGNCRWADRNQQAGNTRRNHIISLASEQRCVAEWSRITGLTEAAIRGRVKMGWKPGDVLRQPLKKSLIKHNDRSQSITTWAKEFGISPALLRYRLDRGWSMKEAMRKPRRYGKVGCPRL